MMFVEIEGPLEKLRPLQRHRGLQFSRGTRHLGGGIHRVHATVLDADTFAALKASGLRVVVTRDEAEVERRAKADLEMMDRARKEYEAEKGYPPVGTPKPKPTPTAETGDRKTSDPRKPGGEGSKSR
jgi:hypothetical protein